MNKAKGQSLIEVLFSLAIVVLVLAGAVTATVKVLKSLRFSKQKTLSVKYAQEQLERARAVRDRQGISALTNACPPASQCYIASDLSIQNSANVIDEFTIYLVFSNTNPVCSNITAEAIVAWSDGGTNHQSNVYTCFTSWR